MTMTYYSPLRYPGGKRRLANFIAKICVRNNINGHYIEPYAGGASVALYLLIKGYVKKITINDLDRAIYAFWHSVLYDNDNLCDKIQKAEITTENWKKQHSIQKNKNFEKDLTKLGFSTFFLNRTNYSGIIDGGVIGGTEQRGKYKIECRFNKQELIKRIKLISLHRKQISLKNLDALDLVKKISTDSNCIFYFDPPYYLKGPSLYMNSYKHEDHMQVSEEIRKISKAQWLVSYDDTFQIQEMYPNQVRRIKYSLVHSARTFRKGSEVLFMSNKLLLPKLDRESLEDQKDKLIIFPNEKDNRAVLS